jgi:hypothetical protein
VVAPTTSPDLDNVALRYSVTALDAGQGQRFGKIALEAKATFLTLYGRLSFFRA